MLNTFFIVKLNEKRLMSNFLQAQKYSAADLTELGLEKNADFSRASLSGQINILKVEAFKNVYEALMEHIIMHGIDVRIDKANLVVQLFNKHVEIASLLKVC